MFDLRIETAPDALRLMQEGWPTRIISLVGDDLRFKLPSFGPHHFIARFHDVEAETHGYVAPTPDLLQATLAHAAGLSDDDRRLVHAALLKITENLKAADSAPASNPSPAYPETTK